MPEPEFLNMQSMGARNQGGIGLSYPWNKEAPYRPARLHRLAEFIPWNRFLGSINVKNTVSGCWRAGAAPKSIEEGKLKGITNFFHGVAVLCIGFDVRVPPPGQRQRVSKRETQRNGKFFSWGGCFM
jgi:hypothetical protein